MQMYSLRFYSPNNFLGKLDKVQEYGLKTIEGGAPARGMSLEDFFKELNKRGIALVSSGVDYARLKSDPDAAVEQAKKLGVKYVMCSWIPHDKGPFSSARMGQDQAFFATHNHITVRDQIKIKHTRRIQPAIAHPPRLSLAIVQKRH